MPTPERAPELDELDRLLNDPDVPLDPMKIWSLLSDISKRYSALAAAEELNDHGERAIPPKPRRFPPQEQQSGER